MPRTQEQEARYQQLLSELAANDALKAEYAQRAQATQAEIGKSKEASMEQAEAQKPRMAAAPPSAGAGYGMTPQPQSLAEEQGKFETARQMVGMGMRVAPSLVEAIMSRGRPSPGLLRELTKYAGLETLGEFLGETVEPGKYRPGELVAAPIRGAVSPSLGLLKTVGTTAATQVGGGMVQRAVEGEDVVKGRNILKDLIPAGMVVAPKAVTGTAGWFQDILEKASERAAKIEKTGATPIVPQVFPGLSGTAQRAERAVGGTALIEARQKQAADIQRRVAELPGEAMPSGAPASTLAGAPSVQDIYRNAIDLLGAPEVQKIIERSTDKKSAIDALQNAIDKIGESAETVGGLAAKSGLSASEQAVEAEKARRQTGIEKLESKAKAIRKSAEAGQEVVGAKALTEQAKLEQAGMAQLFPSGIPKGYNPTQAGYEIEDLISGKPKLTGKPSLKSSWDDYSNNVLYKNIKPIEADKVFDPSDLWETVKSFEERLPSIGIPKFRDFRNTLTEKIDDEVVPKGVSLNQLRELRKRIYDFTNSPNQAYGTRAQSEAKQILSKINETIDTQAPQLFGNQIAQELSNANKIYGEVRPLWDSFFTKEAFKDIGKRPGTMAQKLGNDILENGADAPSYTAITRLSDKLNSIGVQAPSIDRINEIVREKILAEAGGDRNKLANIITKIERTSPGSLAKLGLGQASELNKFNALNDITERTLLNKDGSDFKKFITQIDVYESRYPGSLQAWGIGTKKDLDDLAKQFDQAQRLETAAGIAKDRASSIKTISKLDNVAGMNLVPGLVQSLDNVKDVATVMKNIESLAVAGTTPAVRKSAADAIHNTRAAMLEDVLFGRTEEGVSKGLRGLNLDQLELNLANKDYRQNMIDVLGPNLVSRLEAEIVPGLKQMALSKELAGQAGSTERGQAFGNVINQMIAGGIGGAAGAMTGDPVKAVGMATAAVLTGFLVKGYGPNVAAKFLSKTVGATGLRRRADLANYFARYKNMPYAQAIDAIAEETMGREYEPLYSGKESKNP